MKPSVIFMGTPHFAQTILDELVKAGFPVQAVFAQPDKPAHRGKKLTSPPVAMYAKENNLPLHQPDKLKTDEMRKFFSQNRPDYIVVAAYGKMIPDFIIQAPSKDILNVHASLLPEYRGAAPINYAILDNKKTAGVTIMRIAAKLDAGPMYLKKDTPIAENDDASTLTAKLANLGASALIEAIDKIENDNLKPTEQDESLVSYAPKLSKELALIDWQKPARDIFNQVRALIPWPVARTRILDKDLKVFASEIQDQKSQSEPGTITHISQAGMTVCTSSTDLIISEVQLEGKKRLNAFDLANGLRLKPGMRFLMRRP